MVLCSEKNFKKEDKLKYLHLRLLLPELPLEF